jgi:cytochrome c-type biogenesis protein CcmH/NrfG
VDRAIHYRPASACAYVFKGKLYLANGQSEPAIVAFQQATIMRKDVRSFSHLITAQLAVNKVKDASNAASECLSIAPTAATSHILLGNCLARGTGGQATSDSIRAYQRALELDSRNLMAASLLAQAFSTQDRNKEAVHVLAKTIELSSSSNNTHSPGSGSHQLRTQLARSYMRMENYAAAIMELHLVIELDPDQADAVAELERCEQLMGE